MSDLTLRQEIIAYMQKRGQCCTWWFKFAICHDTKTVRRELEQMEREGLVTVCRRQSNNTKWTLVEEVTHG